MVITPYSACGGILLDSTTPLRENFFDGYAFVGENIIISEIGATEYEELIGKPIRPGNDGCYVTCEVDDDSISIGTDWSGNYPLFIYTHLNFWATSSSFYLLVKHIRKLDLPIDINMGILNSWALPGPLFRQPTSHRTAVRQISVVPSHSTIIARNGKIRLAQKRPVASNILDYESALGAAISDSIQKIATIHGSSLFSAEVNLSGGLDSRTVFAMFEGASLFGAKNIFEAPNRIKSSTSAKAVNDFKAASHIAQKKGLTLNRSDGKSTRQTIPARIALEDWRVRFLGLHGQLTRISAATADLQTFKFGGGGGEGYRNFYNWRELSQTCNRYEKKFVTPEAFAEWQDSFTSVQLQNYDSTQIDEDILHYREFRSRFHSGIKGYHTPRILLLKSQLFQKAFNLRPHHGRTNILHDIIASLDPWLLDAPFDSEEKSLTEEEKRFVIKVNIDHGKVGSVLGSFKCDSEEPFVAPDTSHESVYDLVADRYSDLVSNMRAFGLDHGWIEEGRETVLQAKENGYFKLSKHLMYFHFAELVDFLLE